MAVRKETFVMSVIFNDEEMCHHDAVADLVDDKLFNVDGVIEWDYKITEVIKLDAKINDD
jgi:hypothetical protein